MILPEKSVLEDRRHSTAYVPYSFYEWSPPRYFIDMPMHWHSEAEINYVVRGRGEFLCNGERFLAGEGGLLFISPNMLHAAYPCEESELLYYALVFSPAMLGANDHDRCAMGSIRPLLSGDRRPEPFISAKETDHPDLTACARQIFSCVKDQVPHQDLLLKSELLRFLWLLETDESLRRQKENGPDYGETIRPALEYMMDHYQESISVGYLADLVHLSKSYFMNCFKKATGLSAIGYLNHLRIHAACEALSATRKPVSEIAFGCGYGNLSNFNRQFKKTMGCSPSEFQKKKYPASHSG